MGECEAIIVKRFGEVIPLRKRYINAVHLPLPVGVSPRGGESGLRGISPASVVMASHIWLSMCFVEIDCRLFSLCFSVCVLFI